jgi:hypothetical protein
VAWSPDERFEDQDIQGALEQVEIRSPQHLREEDIVDSAHAPGF